MAPPSRRNDRRTVRSQGLSTRPAKARNERRGDWIWGWHTVVAALENPRRATPRRVLATAERLRALQARLGSEQRFELADASTIASTLPQGATHQGVAADLPPPNPIPLSEMGASGHGVILMLDQVTDPQNIGAIFRSAAALGAHGLVLQDRHAPPLIGALAKVAAGGVDRLPHARETNLARALDRLDDMGWRAVGLDGSAEDALEAVLDSRPTVIVLGSEGEGLRRLLREHCDALARIPMTSGFDSLNVATAAAIALYEASRKR